MTWFFRIAVSCFCALGGPPHEGIRVGPFLTLEGCERVQQATAPLSHCVVEAR